MKDKIRLPSHRDRGRVTCKPRRQIIEKVENMSNLDALIQDLVIANRILAREEVVDAYGNVSVRHPNNPYRFLIARSLAPELVRPEDIVELDLDGQPVRDEDRSLYLERFIHAAIFAARPDVMAVVHAEDTLPFGIAQGTKLRPVIHSGSFIGIERSLFGTTGISAGLSAGDYSSPRLQ